MPAILENKENDRLRAILKEKRVSVFKACKKANQKYSDVMKKFNNEKYLKPEQYIAFSKAFGISLNYILLNKGEKYLTNN